MRLSTSARRARWIRLLISLSLLAQSLIPQAAAAAAPAARAAGKPLPAAGKAAVRQETDAADLPDLEEARRRPQHEPKAIPPVPSTRRRCPPRNPRCNEEADGAPQATPTPTSAPNRPPRGNPHAAATAVEAAPGTSALPPALSLASVNAPLWPLPAAGAGGGRPAFDFSLLDFYAGGGYAVSDSAPALLAGLVAAALPQAGGGGQTYLSDLNWSYSYDDYYATTKDLSVDGTAITLNGVTYQKGLGVHAYAEVRYPLGGNYAAFTSDVGLDDAATSTGSVTFEVWADGTKLYDSGVMIPQTATKSVSVSVAGKQELKLVVTQAGDGPGWDHADWAGARLTGTGSLDPQAVPAQGVPPAESVAWTHAMGVAASGNSLTKTAPAAWDNGGAMSTKAIASGDGYAEFTVSETSTNRMFGLSHGDSDQTYADIDFAVHTQAGGALYVFEGGVNRGQFGTYATGDRLRVSVVGGTVRYSKNGQTFYTSTVVPRYPLLVDTSLYEPGTTLNNALLSGSLVENVVWMNVAGVSAPGNNLSKGGAAGWNAGASSTRVIAGGDGYAEFTAAETNTDRMFGLSRGDSNQDYTDIDFALYAASNSELYVYEAGVYKADLGPYAAGDRLRVSVEGGYVRYRRNGALLYTSATAPQYPLLVDTSLHSTGATVFNAVISAPLPSQVDPGGTGLTGRYYDNVDFTGYAMTRLDYTVNFDWGGGSPTASMGPDDFSVRWTGMVVPQYSETYTFYTTSDDGVRLWVDGQLIIDHWQPQAPYEWSGQITLEAGRAYTIRMEYFEQGGGALAWLQWSSASQAKQIIPQSRLLPCWKPVEQFVTDFYQAVLRRAPTSYELQDWTERLTQAQGESQQIAVAQALGRTLFGPTGMGTEYAALNPSDNHRFVSDLYWGYLQRAPDTGGWSFWEGQVNSYGRGTGIASFEDSIEFKEKVARLCGTSSASGTNGGDGYNFAAARLDQSNRTGNGGADPYSRNYNFSIPLASLAGRAGLDLGLTLSYNSLVWTKDGAGVTFDADRGTPSPGFRLGFPTLQPKFYDPQAQKYAYLLVTPAGGRVELRQVGTSNVYESADSSYLQLTEGGTPTLLSMDGTQLSFTSAGGEWRCYQVRDRNGNYLSAAYYGDGRIWTVTDTLGRTLTFNYDNYQNLLSITQPWRRETEANPNPTQDEAHSWATFGYANVTLQPQFSNLAVIGEQPGTVIPALSQVGLDDGSYYKFSYNQWGQVWKVTRYAADSVGPSGSPNDTHPLASTRLDLPGSDLQAASAQADCPRFTQERTWIENGVMNQSAETTTSYGAWSANMASCDVTVPDGTTYRDIYETSGWKKGLTTESQVWSGGQKKKWTTFTWDQDDTNVGYKVNPRITETLVNDDNNNHKRTTVSFQTFTPPVGGTVALPRDVVQYMADTTNPLRTSRTDYNLSASYTSRRIIGLASYSYVYEGAATASNLRAKVGFLYDQPNDASDTFLAGLPSPAWQHDSTNYGTAFTSRGLTNRVRNYEVNQQTGAESGAYTETRIGYNVTGAVAYSKDGAGHQTLLSYTDSFFQGVNRTAPLPQNQTRTFAYATTMTDPDGFTSSVWYNYDMGLAYKTETPLPDVTTDQPGPEVSRLYDAARRVVRVTDSVNAARTKVVYPASLTLVQTYTLIDTGLENYSASVLDGAGRVRASASTLPYSTGGYSGQITDYDSMGRVGRVSNPTETNAAGSPWAATGDDATANGGFGWAYTQFSYDWKGRPLLMTNPDGTTREYLYGGCGCAGGEMVTIRDEAGRRKRVTSDVLGRAWKTQVLTRQASKPQPFTADPNEAAYSTETNTYDALNNMKEVRERAEATAAEQVTTMTYDGYGRLHSRHTPEQAAAASTVFAYNSDDTLATVTDGRGAVMTYGYLGNNRRLVTSISNTLSGSSVGATFTYDAAGNRKRMDDGQGWETYSYDALSRVTSEQRYFNNLGASYSLSYDYNLNDQLKTLTDPSGYQFNFTRDAAGRLTDVGGAPFGGTSAYVTNARYRAWGGYKGAITYDIRMRPSTYRGGPMLNYSYEPDGRLAQVTDLNDGQGSNPPSTLHFFSLAYTYDIKGRVTHAAGPGNGLSPFNQSYAYDEFGNMTGHSGSYGYSSTSYSDPATYTNNRRDGWTYDADGRLTLSPANSASNRRDWGYDPAGRLASTTETSSAGTSTLTTSYDGDGLVLRQSQVGGANPMTYYLVHSKVLGGQVVTRLTASGAKAYTYVPTEGVNEVWQEVSSYNGQQFVNGTNKDPQGVLAPGGVAYDPLGHMVAVQNPQSGQPPSSGPMYGPSFFSFPGGFTDAYNFSTGCVSMSGMPTDCNSRIRQVMGDDFADNLPGVYNDMGRGEQRYVNDMFQTIDESQRRRAIHGEQVRMTAAQMRAQMSGYRTANGLFDLDIGHATTASESEFLRGGSQTTAKSSLKEVIASARTHLTDTKENEACRALFGRIDPLALLNDLEAGKEGVGSIGFGELGGETESTSAPYAQTKPIYGKDKDGYSVFQGSKIIINSNPAAAWQAGYHGRFKVDDETNRVITLIHELGHVADILTSDDSVKIHDDTGKPDESKKNSERVLEACFQSQPKK